MRYNAKFVLPESHQTSQDVGIKVLSDFLVKEKGFGMEAVRTLVVRYPYVLSKSLPEFRGFFETLKAEGLSDEEIMKALLDCPKLISKKELGKKIKEIQFIFRLYHQINEAEVNDIFRNFPYLYCCEHNKLQKFMGEFRKYRLTKEQIIKVCSQAGGILASKVSNFVGLFDVLRLNHHIKASDVVEMIDHFPEFAYQNKKDLIRRKVELIRKHQKSLSDTFIRHVIKRHPDLFLKSWASMEAKVNYITKNLGHSLQQEKAFPLLLHFNYN